MRFYTETHKHYCGIDLHAKTMYLCILDAQGAILLHRNIPCDSEKFLRTIDSYRDDLVVAVECTFTWYWLADLCAQEGIAFVLGHALYMKAIHGAKAISRWRSRRSSLSRPNSTPAEICFAILWRARPHHCCATLDI